MPAEPSFADKPTLTGELVLLRPVDVSDAAVGLRALADPEVIRLTGTHATFTMEQLERWYATRAEQPDRLDLTIVERSSSEPVGEVVLNGLDPDNRCCGFRINLHGAHLFGRGFGTEATRLALAHAFDTVGLHRIRLEVYAFNPRARRVYEKVGFVHEGTMRDALYWDGSWVNAELMSILAGEWADHGGHPDRAA